MIYHELYHIQREYKGTESASTDKCSPQLLNHFTNANILPSNFEFPKLIVVHKPAKPADDLPNY